MMNEQKIRVFLSLANTLNFTETANELFITQQAVSKHISQMEEHLGFRLFVRSTHNVQLTPAGEALREEAVTVPLSIARCTPLTPEEAAALYGILYKILGSAPVLPEK